MISTIITCKGRLDHLKVTLPIHVVTQMPGSEIVVVDYGCPDGTFNWVRRLNAPEVRCVRLKNCGHFFNPSHARNVGAMHAKHSFLAFSDADVHPADKEWLQTGYNAIAQPSISIAVPEWRRGGAGICFVRKDTFMQLRGFDEAMRGWGWEDIDFRKRASDVGNIGTYSQHLIRILKHARCRSVMYYENKELRQGIPVTNSINRRIAETRVGVVNPSGFGKAEVEVWPA